MTATCTNCGADDVRELADYEKPVYLDDERTPATHVCERCNEPLTYISERDQFIPR